VSAIHAFLNFEEIIEGNPKSRRLHMAQLYADQAGIELDNLKPEYHLAEDEQKWALAAYPRKNGLPRIGIQVIASAFCRTYPQMQMVMAELAKKAEVFLFGSPGQLKMEKEYPNILNLTADKLTFRESAAVLATCNCCISPDSAMVHTASALNVPCVALYGPFPAALRITSTEAVVIEGKAPCAPCYFHADLADEFPLGMPCTKEKMCVAMKSIPPAEVVKQALLLIT
jgi:ADP-heptose:LPS heptosyltransferase